MLKNLLNKFNLLIKVMSKIEKFNIKVLDKFALIIEKF